MKTNELMIGDWMLLNKKPKKVIEIHEHSVLLQGHSFATSEIDIESIPLTPEILEKNGIKLFSTYTHPYRDGEWEEGELEEAMKHYPMYVYEILNPYIAFVIRPNEQELKVCSSNYKTRVEKKEEVIFVHELQHILRLCGIDKEIEL